MQSRWAIRPALGPEILVKLAAESERPAPLIAIGDAGVLRRAARDLGLALKVETIAAASDHAPAAGLLQVIEPEPPLEPMPALGVVDGRSGMARLPGHTRGD